MQQVAMSTFLYSFTFDGDWTPDCSIYYPNIHAETWDHVEPSTSWRYWL
jgi:hypothetical protein